MDKVLTDTHKETDRIECAIRHIESSLDVDPWACEIAVDAMRRQLPQIPERSGRRLYCPRCGDWVGARNATLNKWSTFNEINRKICVHCGQVFDLDGLSRNEKEEEMIKDGQSN